MNRDRLLLAGGIGLIGIGLLNQRGEKLEGGGLSESKFFEGNTNFAEKPSPGSDKDIQLNSDKTKLEQSKENQEISEANDISNKTMDAMEKESRGSSGSSGSSKLSGKVIESGRENVYSSVGGGNIDLGRTITNYSNMGGSQDSSGLANYINKNQNYSKLDSGNKNKITKEMTDKAFGEAAEKQRKEKSIWSGIKRVFKWD